MAESSLTGFLVKQAFKSRKEAKAEKARQDKSIEGGKKVDDKDRKGLFRKAFTKNLFGGLFGGRSATGGGSATATGAMLGGGKKKKQKQSKGGGKSSGGKAKGLEKILLTGFGSLAADTTAISGGLAALTEIMNSQLNVEGDMSSNIQGINAILADQLEVQTAFLDAIGGGNRSNDTGASNTGISSSGPATKSPNSGSLIGSLLNRAKDLGTGAILSRSLGIARLALTNPWVFTIGGGIVAGMVASEAIKNKDPFSQTPIYPNDPAKDEEARKSLPPTMGGNAPVSGPQHLPSGDPRKWSYEHPGQPIPPEIKARRDAMPIAGPWDKRSAGGINLVNRIESSASKMSSGGNMLSNFISLSMGGMTPTAVPQSSTAYPMATGGSKAMIGEAGKEAVVPLHSADSPAKSKVGMDPSMQASAGSMLAVTDQFIKSMGALGGPVSQALGSDISNLAKTFGMSQTLPNLSLGGGKFREDTTAKKGREKFLKDLIAGSLEALGGKKKQEPVSGTTPPPPPPPPDPNNPALTPGNPDGTRRPEENGNGRPMDPASNGNNVRNGRNGSGAVTSASPNLTANEARGITDNKQANRRSIPIAGYPDYYVLSNRANGDFEIWKKGIGGSEIELYGAKKQKIILAADATTGKLKDPLSAAAFNAVRANYMSEAPEMGLRFRYLTEEESNRAISKRNQRLTRGNQETGGTTIKSFQGGGGLDWLWKWLTTPMGQGASKPAVRGLQDAASSGQMGGLSKSLSDKRRMYEELGIAKPYEKGGTTVSSFKSSPAPKVSAASYTPMATPMTESADIGAIVNIVGSQAQQPIPIMPNNEGQSTSDYVAAPMGGGLAFTVLSTSQWGG